LTREFIDVLIAGMTVGIQLEEVFLSALLRGCIEIWCMEGAVHCAEVVGQVVYHGRLRRQNSVRFGGEAEITQQIGAFDWVFALDGVQNGCVPSASLGRRQWGWFKVTAGIYEFAVEEHLADKGGVQSFIHDTSNRALIHDMDVG